MPENGRRHVFRQPAHVIKLRNHDQFGLRAKLPQFCGREGPQRSNLDQADLDALVCAQPDGLPGLSGRTAGCDQDRVRILSMFGRAEPAHVLVDVFPRALDRRPDLLLPDRMDVVSHEVGLLDRRVPRQPSWRVLRIQHRHGPSPGFPRRQLDASVLHVHVAAGMSYEEAVAGHPNRQRDIVLLADNEPLHDEVEQVLLVLGVKDDHATVQQVRDLDIVGLDCQRRIHDAAGKHGDRGQPMPGPRRDRLKAAQGARSRRRREAAHSRPRRAGDRRHHPVFFLTAVVFFDIPFAVQHPDELHGFALRGDRVGDRQVHV